MALDTFVLYLIVVNVVAFVAFVVDYLLCRWRPELDDTAANSLVMDVFPLAGGVLGMLIALSVLTGLGRGHRMNKQNVAWWFLAIVCLVVWGLVAAARFGLVTLNASFGVHFAGWDLGRLKILGIYLLVINVVTFAAYAWDKHVAATDNDHGKRTPEARLLGLALVGGSIGGLLAMYLVRHKTRKWYFVWGLPLFAVLNVVLVVYAHLAGVL